MPYTDQLLDKCSLVAIVTFLNFCLTIDHRFSTEFMSGLFSVITWFFISLSANSVLTSLCGKVDHSTCIRSLHPETNRSTGADAFFLECLYNDNDSSYIQTACTLY